MSTPDLVRFSVSTTRFEGNSGSNFAAVLGARPIRPRFPRFCRTKMSRGRPGSRAPRSPVYWRAEPFGEIRGRHRGYYNRPSTGRPPVAWCGLRPGRWDRCRDGFLRRILREERTLLVLESAHGNIRRAASVRDCHRFLWLQSGSLLLFLPSNRC